MKTCINITQRSMHGQACDRLGLYGSSRSAGFVYAKIRISRTVVVDDY